MSDESTAERMLPGLQEVAQRAKEQPAAKFYWLAPLLDQDALARAYHRLRKDAAVGVDGVTKEQYGANLEANLRDLQERLKAKRYRHQPIRRVHIPKDKGRTRPIGISATEDKVVQGALTEVLEVIYEQDFLDCSHGFRPGRKALDAIRALDRVLHRGKVSFILEADIVSFFDSLDRDRLREMLQIRVADGRILQLIGKCLHVGVLDGDSYEEAARGTAQGSVISPLLGNIYLHYVLDRWFHDEVRGRLKGEAHLIRYADDFVITFESREDAERVMEVLPKRMGQFGLTLHPEKTRLVPFERPSPRPEVKRGSATLDFLGFTVYWKRGRTGRWQVAFKTRSARRTRFINSVTELCRRQRHQPVAVQHAALCRRLQGHFNYFGVSGNVRALGGVRFFAERAWHKWLTRRSQRSRLNWKRFKDLLRDFPLPRPRVYVPIWQT